MKLLRFLFEIRFEIILTLLSSQEMGASYTRDRPLRAFKLKYTPFISNKNAQKKIELPFIKTRSVRTDSFFVIFNPRVSTPAFEIIIFSRFSTSSM
jgi:hypothetical protein